MGWIVEHKHWHAVDWLHSLFAKSLYIHAVAYAENFHGGFIQWHMVVICMWCALFVTSQFDVIFMSPNQGLAKFVDIICIFFYTHSS